MNITFFIGNGFDINCGMRTRYTDMYKRYTQENPDDSEVIKRFKNAIKKERYETWADFEMGMCKYASELNSEEELVECVHDFKEHLVIHLLNEEERFFNSLSLQTKNEILVEMTRSIWNYYMGLIPNDIRTISNLIDANEHVTYNFISLNYTSVLNSLLNQINFSYHFKNYTSATVEQGVVINLHGTLIADVILGIDNETQFGALKFSPGADTKYAFIKPESNNSYDSYRVSRAKFIIGSSDLICVYGAALGDSDLSWRSEILDWLLIDSDHHLVYFEYFVNHIDRMHIDNTLKEESIRKQRLLRRFNVSDDISEKLSKQIHIPISSNIFNISNIIEDDAIMNAKIVGKNADAAVRSTGSAT